MPNWVGLDSREASVGHDGRGDPNDPNIPGALKLGLLLTNVVQPGPESPPFSSFIVLATSPAAGQPAQIGSTVTVFIQGQS